MRSLLWVGSVLDEFFEIVTRASVPQARWLTQREGFFDPVLSFVDHAIQVHQAEQREFQVARVNCWTDWISKVGLSSCWVCRSNLECDLSPFGDSLCN
jgi:hypothetical protein